jgi:hypothetical protein
VHAGTPKQEQPKTDDHRRRAVTESLTSLRFRVSTSLLADTAALKARTQSTGTETATPGRRLPVVRFHPGLPAEPPWSLRCTKALAADSEYPAGGAGATGESYPGSVRAFTRTRLVVPVAGRDYSSPAGGSARGSRGCPRPPGALTLTRGPHPRCPHPLLGSGPHLTPGNLTRSAAHPWALTLTEAWPSPPRIRSNFWFHRGGFLKACVVVEGPTARWLGQVPSAFINWEAVGEALTDYTSAVSADGLRFAPAVIAG